MMFVLTLDSTTQGAKSLIAAKALAPQMFARMGTQVLFKQIQITDGGHLVATYGRKGWHDISEADQPAVETARLDEVAKWDCLVENPGNRVHDPHLGNHA
jgi:hypothetical protein